MNPQGQVADAITAAGELSIMQLIVQKLGEINSTAIFLSVVGLLGIWLWRRGRRGPR